MGFFSLLKRWLKGNLVTIHNCMNYSYTNNGAKLFLGVLDDIMEYNVQKLQLGRFMSDTRTKTKPKSKKNPSLEK